MIERGKYNDIHSSAKIANDVIASSYCYIAEGVEIGEGTRLGNAVDINRNVRIGRNCNLQTKVVLSSGTIVGDNCFFAGGVLVADIKFPGVGKQNPQPTVFGNNVVVGMGALIIGGISIGNFAVIGMGAVVTKDVPVGQVWVGNPAVPFINKATRKPMTRQEFDERKAQWEKRMLG